MVQAFYRCKYRRICMWSLWSHKLWRRQRCLSYVCVEESRRLHRIQDVGHWLTPSCVLISEFFVEEQIASEVKSAGVMALWPLMGWFAGSETGLRSRVSATVQWHLWTSIHVSPPPSEACSHPVTNTQCMYVWCMGEKSCRLSARHDTCIASFGRYWLEPREHCVRRRVGWINFQLLCKTGLLKQQKK